MSVLFFLVSCSVAVLVQNVYGECLIRNSYNVGSFGCGSAYNELPLPSPWLRDTCSAGFESGKVPASDGGGFAVKSASPVSPSGVSVLSENEYAGILAVAGQLPFLGTTYLEGSVPSAGNGAVTYGCGYGEVAIVSEDSAGHSSLPSDAFARLPGTVAPRARDTGCGCGIWG